LRSTLAMMVNERQVRFSAFHEKLKEVVPDTYALIQQYRTAAYDYTKRHWSDQDPPLEELRNRVNETNKEFWAYFGPNELYFSDSLAAEIRTLVDHSFQACQHFSYVHQPKPGSELPREDCVRFSERCESFLDNEEKLFIEIRKEFRSLIDAPLDENCDSAANPNVGSEDA
jgi:hypothetical protein